MKVSRKQIKQIDKYFLAIIPVIVFISIIAQISASTVILPDDPFFYVRKHLVALATGVFLFIMSIIVDYRSYRSYNRILYVGMLLFILTVWIPGLGYEANNARSWIALGPLSLQPGELVKILYIVLFADFLEKRKGEINNLQQIFFCFLFLLPPLFLIALQPDMGTGLVYIAITIVMMYMAGANPKILFGLVGGGLLAIILLVFSHLKFGLPLPLKEYQLMRLIVFMDPYNDGQGGLGAGYNIIQSLIAIGSGGIFGKGFLQGTQSQSKFLPYPHTDFIFAVLGEEFGFIGSVFVLLCFFFLIYRALKIAREANDVYGAILVSGVVGMIFFHILESAGMCMGMMPITGIPFPFLSNGGTSLWNNFIALGLIVNISMRKKELVF